jgi:transcriptional regulator with XRE-family HTH domain
MKTMNRTAKLAKGTAAAHPEALRKCVDCGATMKGSRQTYRYSECGLKSVHLSNVLVFDCEECGAKVPEIPAIDQLHQFIAIDILRKKSLLSGEEIRFLRKMAGLMQSDLAEIMGVHATRPSKWETDGEPIGKENDRVLRSCCLFGMIQQSLTVDDPVKVTRSSAAIIRNMDVREIFKQIKGKTSVSKNVQVEGHAHPIGPEQFWSLPDSTVVDQGPHVN